MASNAASRPIIEIEAPHKSVISKAPIVHEYIIPEHKQVIQPVIHREVVKTEVRHIVQPIYEEVTKEVEIHEEVLSKSVQEKFDTGVISDFKIEEFLKTRNEGSEPKIITTYAAPIFKKIILQPIIYERVIPEIIEEIQPIIHRTVHESHIVKKQEIIEETVQQVQETTVVREAVVQTERTDVVFDTKIIQKEIEQIETDINVQVIGRGAL